jgi:hypothetical protein
MKVIQAKYILQQLNFDLIGKDSYRGITLTYAWMANQFGHIALGFIPTILIYQILKPYLSSQKLNLYTGIGVSMFWLFFETYNSLGPILRKTNVYVFNPDFSNLAFDTATDVCFFALGGFLAATVIQISSTLVVLNVMLLAAIAYPSYYWYTTKMYQQEAKLPFQFRLSQWQNKLDENSKQIITNYMNSNQNGQHLLIFGTYKKGKTSLSVAIANEESIRHKKALYTSATKLYNQFYEPDLNDNDIKINNLWNWRNTNYLVIDDISPSIKTNDGTINPQTFYQLLNNNQYGKENINAIKQTNIIWVLGDDENALYDWKQLLLSMGIPQSNINAVYL